MSKVLSVALFASLATAQMTTSAWMPGMEDGEMSFTASVVSVNKDRTVLSLDYSISMDYVSCKTCSDW